MRLIQRCPTCGAPPKRSSEQNRYYWKLIHGIEAKVHPKGIAYSDEVWSLFFKGKFLGREEVKLPNGKIIETICHTAHLSVEEMAQFITQVEAWAADHGVFLEGE